MTSALRAIVALFALAAVAAGVVLQVDRAGSSAEGAIARSSGLVVVRLPDGPAAAVVAAGGDRPAAAIALPPSVSLTIRRQGEGTVAEAATLPGPEAIAAVSNLLGVWISHYAITDTARLAERIDRQGGLSVFGERVSGAEVVSALGEPDALATWREVLEALLSEAGPWPAGDLVETDGAVVERLLSAAGDAPVTTLPTADAPGELSQIDDAAAAPTLRAFGRDAQPIPSTVLNGNGVPGVGRHAAELLIPAGFRIVSSGNASSFDHRVTLVVANGPDEQLAAARAQAALGLGRVSVAAVPSGLASVTIVLGKDFHA